MGYDSDFRVTSQTVNGANGISFGYDADGLLTAAGALGLRRSATTGFVERDSLSGIKGIWTYDPKAALASYTATVSSGDTLFRTSYVRDSLSRISELTEIVAGDTTVAEFTYDDAGRLETVTRNGQLTASYDYDDNGNRLSLTTQGGTVTGTYDDQDRLTSYGDATYTYVRNGELAEKVVGTDTTRYTYDALGNLTAVTLPDGTEIEYVIDPQNRRIGKKVDGGPVQGFLWQGQLAPVAELDSLGNVVSRFVYATRVNVPDYLVKNDTTYRLVLDHLGSVRLVVSTANDSVVQRLDYDEFGVVTLNTNPGFQPFGFAGGLYDEQTGLVRFGARDYDAHAGRWTTKDPVDFAAGDANLFGYVRGDAANEIDPAGLFPRSQQCASILRRIRNLQSKIDERLGELHENPLRLPGSCPGDRAKPGKSRRGHRWLIEKDKAQLAFLKGFYLSYCGGGDPPFGLPAPGQFFSREYWEEVTGLTGSALIAYLIVSEGSRLIPARNLVPAP